MTEALMALGIALAMVGIIPETSPKVKVGGYVDGYYQYDIGPPRNGETVNGRGFDTFQNQPRLAFAELDLSLDPKPFGFNLQLYAGRGPELIHLAEPGGRNKYRYVRQAYASYAGKNVNVDFGKFDTWIGYEGIDNRSQDEYSRSFNWTYSEPTYETGVRASTKLTTKLTGTLYVVQGWNEVEDGNGGKSFGAALSYLPDDKTSLTLQNHYGEEGSNTANDIGSYGGIGYANPGVSRTHLIDFIAAKQVTPSTKIAFNADYATASDAPNKGNWNGEVVYVRHQLRPNQALGGRIERFEDSDGLRTGAPIQLYSVTATYDYTFSEHITGRFELRHDLASKSFFNGDTGPKKNRTTLSVAAVVKF